jgi:hypothetical protein
MRFTTNVPPPGHGTDESPSALLVLDGSAGIAGIAAARGDDEKEAAK